MPEHTNLQLREAVINLFQQGKLPHEIANSLLINKSAVNRIIAKYKSTNSLANKPQSGRPRKTTKRVDKMIKRKSIDVEKTIMDISRELREKNLADVNRSTISRYTSEGNRTNRTCWY